MDRKVFLWFQPLSSWAGPLSWSKDWKSSSHSQLLQGELLYIHIVQCVPRALTDFLLQAGLFEYAQFWTFWIYARNLKQKRKKRWVFFVLLGDNPVFPSCLYLPLPRRGFLLYSAFQIFRLFTIFYKASLSFILMAERNLSAWVQVVVFSKGGIDHCSDQYSFPCAGWCPGEWNKRHLSHKSQVLFLTSWQFLG